VIGEPGGAFRNAETQQQRRKGVAFAETRQREEGPNLEEADFGGYQTLA
jgi:hypothetical protein